MQYFLFASPGITVHAFFKFTKKNTWWFAS